MGRRALSVLLVAVPAAALGALGIVVVASATAQQGAAMYGVAAHFAARQVFALILAALVAIVFVQLGARRVLRGAPLVFLVALAAVMAVFAPGVGVRAAGANRWLHFGPVSFNPASLLTTATAMLMAAWAAAGPDRARASALPPEARGHRAFAIGLGVLGVLTLAAEPDFSAAAVTAFVMLIAFAGAGVGGRRLIPAAAGAVLLLGVLASRFGYVSGRVSGFLAPEADRRGKGYEVLALARAQAAATRTGVGLGHGLARRRLSSPGSDYVFAVVNEELGRVAAGGVIAAWASIAAGTLLAARGTRDPRLRAAALGAGAAALAPAALHIAVCQGWVPIIGVSMPLVSYDPAATLATGAQVGLIAAVALAGGEADAHMTPIQSLLQRRFLVLSGKGGVGRTTVAAALARAAADAGKRVLVAQASSAERLGRLFGRFGPVGTEGVTLAPGIDAVNMTPQSALHQYGLMVLHSELVYRALFENRAVRGFLGAIPGLDAYAMLGKAWWHTTEMQAGRPRYDLVILDGPASGHANLMLRIPNAILKAMPKGPLASDARAMRALLSDPVRAALVIVTLPEDLPARETAELATAARTLLDVPVGPIIVNAVPSSGLSGPDADAVLGTLDQPTGNPGLDATLRLAGSLRAHRRVADEVLERLRRDPGGPLVNLLKLPTADLGPNEVAILARHFVDEVGPAA